MDTAELKRLLREAARGNLALLRDMPLEALREKAAKLPNLILRLKVAWLAKSLLEEAALLNVAIKNDVAQGIDAEVKRLEEKTASTKESPREITRLESRIAAGEQFEDLTSSLWKEAAVGYVKVRAKWAIGRPELMNRKAALALFTLAANPDAAERAEGLWLVKWGWGWEYWALR